MTQVSLSTSTDYSGEQNALIEELETALTVNFELDEAAPNGGLKVFVNSNIEQIVNRLDLPGFAFNPVTENIDPVTFGTSFDNSGFYLTIDEGATSASFTIKVFDNEEPDTFLPETFDGKVEAKFSLVVPGEVAEEDTADVGTLGDYTINPNAASTTVIFADKESQLTNIPEPPTVPEPTATEGLQVSLFGGPSYLIEENKTVTASAFLATNGTIPEGGLVVSVDVPNLSEFDLTGVSVEGGEVVEVRDGGFDLLMREYTTLVNLPVADDGETEADETATFSLAAGDGYEIVEEYSSNTFKLVDMRSDIPRGIVTEPNDIVSVVTDTEITPENPTFSAVDSIYFDIGNRYLNPDGTYTYIDYNEDVDLYQVDLSAGDTIAIETFEVKGNPDAGFIWGFDKTVAVLDTEGNRLAVDGLGFGAAPDKLFGTGSAFNEDGTIDENQTDNYLEFTAPEDGVYYVSVTSEGSGFSIYRGADSGFSLENPGLGDNNTFSSGNYEIEIDLLTPDNPRKTVTPTPPVSNPNVTNPPTLFLSANPTTVDSEGNFTNAVVEFVEDDGVSSVNFTIQAEGEIPEGGIEFVLNSNVNLYDYVGLSRRARNLLPSTIGGQSLGAFYNEDGIPGGIRLRIEEPTMTVSLIRTAPRSARREIIGSGLFFEELETDGAEDVTFFLQSGEGYEIDSNAGTTEVTYYDSLEDVPTSTGSGDTVPEVGVTVSETELIESQGTETTLTFTLSEPPPAEGVTVYLDSENEPLIGSVLGQFLVLESVIEGGDFPVPNGDASGFFFNITEQTATITLSVFDELSVTDDVFAVKEGLVAIDFALVPQAGYTIDESASEINFTIADNPESQVLIVPTAATVDDEESTTLIESEGSVGVLNLNLSTLPPAEGITTTISTSSLDDFDLDAIEVEGGIITEIRDSGFDVTVTERQAKINLPVAADGATEVSETATFTIEPGDAYELSDLTEVTFTLADTPDQASVSEEIEGNDILSDANALGLSAENSTVSISGQLGGALGPFGSDDPFGSWGYPEDVDFYSVTLDAGQTIALDIDTGEPVPADSLFPFSDRAVFVDLLDVAQTVDTELRLFDIDGNELAANNDGVAPNEEFSRDPFIEYTADSAGTYYVGVSMLGNRNYDPNVVRSGSGWTFPEVGVFFGDYELTASLVDGTGNPEPPTNTEKPTTEPIFGSLEGDIIEVSGTSQLIFGGDSDDLIDAFISSGGDNRIYAAVGDDTVILGMSDRVIGGEGADKFFATSGGDNILTGGAGADQFWIATAETPDSANIIIDFTSGEDVLGIAGLGIGFDDLSITQQDDNTLIAANGSDLAILQGIGADSLIADNFAFA